MTHLPLAILQGKVAKYEAEVNIPLMKTKFKSATNLSNTLKALDFVKAKWQKSGPLNQLCGRKNAKV